MLHFGWPFFVMVTYSHFCHSIGSLLWLFRASLYESWVSIRWDPQSEQTWFRHFAAIPSSGRYTQTVMSDNFCFDMSLKMLNSAMSHLVANFFKPSTLSKTLQHWPHRQVLQLVSDTLWTCLGLSSWRKWMKPFDQDVASCYIEEASDNVITIRCFWTLTFSHLLSAPPVTCLALVCWSLQRGRIMTLQTSHHLEFYQTYASSVLDSTSTNQVLVWSGCRYWSTVIVVCYCQEWPWHVWMLLPVPHVQFQHVWIVVRCYLLKQCICQQQWAFF